MTCSPNINNVAGLGNDKFAMKLNYANASHAQYNGNIASMQWNTARFGPHTYQFVYDKASRLKNGYTTNYNTSYSYYDNGNLKTLTRQGRFGSGTIYGMIDELTYDYSGNKLLAVNDVDELNHQYNGFSDNYSFATNEFTYDANGNMVSDQNKDLDIIEYNYLNLPQQINFSEGYQEINYLYTANGHKLMKQTRTDNEVDQTVDYIGSFVYEDGTLTYLLTDEGRVVVNSGPSYEYQYFLKDHLGNTRITFNQNGQIIQEDAYYPFGMQMNGLCYQSGVDYENKYLYNSKELQDEFGLDWYDYGARMYDAVIGRWHSVDPHSENYYTWSTYHYAANNPIIITDPDGQDWYTSVDGSATIWRKGSKEIEGYKNIGTDYTQNIGVGVSISYTQNEATLITESVLNPSDFKTQMSGKFDENGKPINKDGDAGNCYYQAGEMVKKSGAESLAGDVNKADDGIKYVDLQIDNGHSTRVYVDRNTDGNGDHWVAISSRITDLKTNLKSYGFYDPAAIYANKGGINNKFNIINGKLSGTANAYKSGKVEYEVVQVRRNKN